MAYFQGDIDWFCYGCANNCFCSSIFSYNRSDIQFWIRQTYWSCCLKMSHKWYIVHAYSGFEKKVAAAISEKAKTKNIESAFSEIIVPTEEVVEVKKGKKRNAERKFFPGYVLTKMEMTDETYHMVKALPKVSGFLGHTQGKPSAVPESEINKILQDIEEGVTSPKPSITFEVGEQVRVSDGPFASFNGLIEEIDEERARVKVSVSIFGRSTPVELEYTQVEKA